MHAHKNEINYKSLLVLFLLGIAMAVCLGLFLRPIVSHAEDLQDATLTDAQERLEGFRTYADSVQNATPTDPDKHPYLTNDVALMQTNDLLLSIRNILVCIWFTILLLWSYDRLKATIMRLGGFRKND